MKNLKTYILEGSLLDDIDDILADGDVKVPHALIQEYLEDNYRGKWTISKKKDKDGKFIVNSRGEVHHKGNSNRLTNDMFKWGKVKKFVIKYPYNLESLEGSPKEVEDFECRHADQLVNLVGGPEIVKGDYDICFSSVKSLEGSPKEIDGSFFAMHCDKLETLEGAPEFVREYFKVDESSSLKSLKGAPKYVGGMFNASECSNLESLEGGPEDVLHFYVDFCVKLKSFKGAPKNIRGTFAGDYCKSLEKLDMDPNTKIGRNFILYDCKSLKSLEGAPKYIGDTFDISNCDSITSLKGLENTNIGKTLNIVRCYNLKKPNDLIKYTPKVGEMIDFHFGGVKLTPEQLEEWKKKAEVEVISN